MHKAIIIDYCLILENWYIGHFIFEQDSVLMYAFFPIPLPTQINSGIKPDSYNLPVANGNNQE
ncbi:MAG: hypothetical protein V7K69_30900 [Nostoc sp.]